MSFESTIKKTLSLIAVGTREQATASPKSWFSPPSDHYYVTDFETYTRYISELCEIDVIVSKRFSRKTVHEFVEKEIIKSRIHSTKTPSKAEDFFKEFHNIKSANLSVAAPISGIRLDGVSEFEISVFKFGPLQDLKYPIANDTDGLYACVSIQDVYDPIVAIDKAENAFSDFGRLIAFLSGKQDRSIFIKTGLPLFPSVSHELMYVDTSSYLVTDADGNLDSCSVGNKNLEKLPVNHEFFCRNPNFSKLWSLFSKRHEGKKISDMESRILNSALSLGESALTLDPRNSIIYTCISLETLFSFDEGSLFQKSIGEKLADIFAFIVAKDKDSRLTASKMLKKVYSMRSAIVHGGNQMVSNENLVMNVLVRASISELLNNEKFKDISKISQLYEQLKSAQYSY